MLVVLAVAKLFATGLVLATGWKGGYIFPIMFCRRCPRHGDAPC